MRKWKYLKYDLQQKWENREFRKLLNSYPRFAIYMTIGTVSLFLLILIIKFWPYSPSSASLNRKAWFYDLNTKKLFAEDSDKIPPIDSPSGKTAGVKAHVLSYSLEPNESDRFIAYLEKFTPEGRKHIKICRQAGAKITAEMIQQLNKNRFISSPNDISWFLADSEQGREILQRSNRANDKGQMPIPCLPKIK